jgi:hypothetical protein
MAKMAAKKEGWKKIYSEEEVKLYRVKISYQRKISLAGERRR